MAVGLAGKESSITKILNPEPGPTARGAVAACDTDLPLSQHLSPRSKVRAWWCTSALKVCARVCVCSRVRVCLKGWVRQDCGMHMVIYETKANIPIHIHHYSGHYKHIIHTRQRQIVYRGVGAHAGQERLFAPATPVGVSLLELEVTMVASLCDYEVTS